MHPARTPIVTHGPLPRDYRHQVVVQFHDDFEPPPLHDPRAHVASLSPGAAPAPERPSWLELQRAVPGAQVRPLTAGLNPERLRRLCERATRAPGTRPIPRLDRLFTVILPPGVPPDRVLAVTRRWQGVRYTAVRPLPAPPPVVTSSDDPVFTSQGHLQPAPAGVGATSAWASPGGDGSGVGFVDIEYGWNLSHEDLVAASVGLIGGTNSSSLRPINSTVSHSDRIHGTNALGVVAARDNTKGVLGVAPAVNARVCGSMRSGTLDHFTAILDAALHMAEGDVLLLEQQHGDFAAATSTWSNYRPIEVDPMTWLAIRLATYGGIVVVEAGGNGGVNLDNWTEGTLGKVLAVGDAAFSDSGAIIVGAGTSTTPHRPHSFTASGRRIDCWAWGDGVFSSTTDAAGTATTLYSSGTVAWPDARFPFSGTSSASAIVAGVACVAQAIYKRGSGGTVLTSQQLRAIFRRTGTPATLGGTWTGGPIGLMPDLAAIVTHELAMSHGTPAPLAYA